MEQGSRSVAVLFFVVALAAMFAMAQDQPRVTGIELEVKVDDSMPCALNMNAMIHTNGKPNVWYRFEGPTGTTFDFGAEDTGKDTFGTGIGVGKGAKFTTDIRGQFTLKAAVIGKDGKPGAIVSSKAVPGNYTCGNGKVAHAVAPNAPLTPASKLVGEVTSANLEVTIPKGSKCTINLRGEIATVLTKKVWYRFEAPPGSTFDYAAEYTEDVEPGSTLTLDKSISFTKDIHGVLVLRTAPVDENGKKGRVVSSKILPGHYTCGGGTQIAKPIAPGARPTAQPKVGNAK